MSRRKHVTRGLEHVEAPTDTQRIVHVIGTRGGNIVEVSYPDGSTTLCMLPSKFNKTLWIKRGGYVLIEEGQVATATQSASQGPGDPAGKPGPPETGTGGEESAQSRGAPISSRGNKVTGTIAAILYDQQVRQLKRMKGVWPVEFSTVLPAAGSQSTELDSSTAAQERTGDANGQPAGLQASSKQADGAEIQREGSDEFEEEDDSLPPLQQNNNRKVIYHYLDESDDEEEER
mmetsp:Transcript_16659/g.28595  ORF Transcript_16659/g.28595 Transcript_16659/m.28595 type:complete len:232 (+) Transcript_16659:130-825(+)|eukprot:CAMPEP_0119108114 /NCGR_PEP_ID=MMETSP1180-20130426/13475_1 /TAXON_ID=3052 ORGANISM="Chlamydomonas cf sp, Strain CCMP681" /NCGR_SAMPLE_ID=MMETSP1180 /ASSEMBLY_ACC=CAM_ASM_000741 /LENGTH=231 /DNA_ID=CAMNT_0007093697 /DNA_START=130 /DNA_END=825 /DNA_ORIENTATION=+